MNITLFSTDIHLEELILKKIIANNQDYSFYFIQETKELFHFLLNNSTDVLVYDLKSDEQFKNNITKIHKKYTKLNLFLINNDESEKPFAFDIKASAYLSRPISIANFKKELSDLRYPISENTIELRIQCFGNFSVFKPNGEIIRFSRSKARELLAYLVSKSGTEVSTKEIAAVLFEDHRYDKQLQTYLQQLFYTLNNDLKENGAPNVLVRKYNSSSINVQKVDCDYFRYVKGDNDVKRLYNGQFMMQYEWADYIGSYLDRDL